MVVSNMAPRTLLPFLIIVLSQLRYKHYLLTHQISSSNQQRHLVAKQEKLREMSVNFAYKYLFRTVGIFNMTFQKRLRIS
jgi:hypothetical protein